MKPTLTVALAIAALPIFITACATPPPPQAFHNSDNTALIVESLDGKTSEIIQPTASRAEGNDKVLAAAALLAKHETAVVILENYTEARIGDQFRDRGTPWFIGLRGLGYEHIYFLQGHGAANPEGLPTLVAYE